MINLIKSHTHQVKDLARHAIAPRGVRCPVPGIRVDIRVDEDSGDGCTARYLADAKTDAPLVPAVVEYQVYNGSNTTALGRVSEGRLL